MVSDFRNAGAPVTAVDFNNNVTDIRRAVLHESPGILMDSSPMGGTSIAPVRQKRQIWDSGVDKDPAPFTLKWINTNAKEKTYNATESDREFRKMSANYYPIVHLPKCAVDTTPDDYAICLNPALDIFADSAWNNGNWCYLVNEKYDYNNGYSFSISGETASRLVPATDMTDVDVYLHVRLSDDEDFKKKILGANYAGSMSSADTRLCAYVVTTSQSVPAALGGEETRCVCVGRLFCPTQSQIKDSYVPRVTSQYIRSQFNCATEESEETIPRPFTLKVYKDKERGKCYPLVYLPYGAVQVHDGDAVAFAVPCNNDFSDDVWFYIANNIDSYGRSDSPTLDTIPYSSDGYLDAYLFVARHRDEIGYETYIYGVLFGTEWPNGVEEDDRLACVYLGAFARDTKTDENGKSETVYIVAEQLINEAQTVKLVEEENYPFKFKYITDAYGSQRLVVYLPKWSMRRYENWTNDLLYKSNEAYCENTAVSGMTDWYYVDAADKGSKKSPYLFLFSKSKGFDYVKDIGYSYYETYFFVARATEYFARNLRSSALGEYYSRSVLVGREDGSGRVESYLHGAYYTTEDAYDRTDDSQSGGGTDEEAIDKKIEEAVKEVKDELDEKITELTDTLNDLSENFDQLVTEVDDALTELLESLAAVEKNMVEAYSNIDGLSRKLDAYKEEESGDLSEVNELLTEITETLTDFYEAFGNHAHGAITNDGKIEGCEDSIVVTGPDGGIEATSGFVPAGYLDGGVSYLGEVVGLFDYDKSQKQPITLSTDKLKYKDSSNEKHSNDCLLLCLNNGTVTHSGNNAWTVLKAIADYAESDGCIYGGMNQLGGIDTATEYVDLPFYLKAPDTEYIRDDAQMVFAGDIDSTSDRNKTRLYVAPDKEETQVTYGAIKSIVEAFEMEKEADAYKSARLKRTNIGLDENDSINANEIKALVFKGGTSGLSGDTVKSASAELADVAVLAPKTGDKDQSADNAPKSDAVPADNDDDAAKIARVGTSGYAARADHVHPWPVCSSDANKEMSLTGTADNQKRAISFTLGNTKESRSMYVCSGWIKSDSQITLYFREIKINRYGVITYAGNSITSGNNAAAKELVIPLS